MEHQTTSTVMSQPRAPFVLVTEPDEVAIPAD
jgi:hypothetical protein